MLLPVNNFEEIRLVFEINVVSRDGNNIRKFLRLELSLLFIILNAVFYDLHCFFRLDLLYEMT